MAAEHPVASPQSQGQVTLEYFGHCAFLWTTAQGVRALIDPYRNQEDRFWFLRQFPPVEADVVMVTHDHFDHNAVDRVSGLPTVLRGPGEFRYRDLAVHGVLEAHARRQGSAPRDNVIFVVETGGIRFCHLGDNRGAAPSHLPQAIGRVDVLMLPVDDSWHILSYQEAEGLVQLLRPRVVIPTHYLIPGLTTQESTLGTVEGWLKGRDRVRRFDPGSLVLSPETLPSAVETWVPTPRLDAVLSAQR